MPLVAECPSCGRKLAIPEHLAGRAVRCPKCTHAFSVEAPPDPAPAPAPLSRRRDDEDDYEERPRRKRRRRYDDDRNPGRGGLLVTFGVTSMVLGVSSVAINFIPVIGCFSFVTIIAGLILGIVGCSMARADLTKIRRGRISRGAEAATKAGYVTGLIGAIINAILLAFICVLFMIGFIIGVRQGLNNAPNQPRGPGRISSELRPARLADYCSTPCGTPVIS